MPTATLLQHHVYLIWGKLSQRKSSQEILRQLLAEVCDAPVARLKISRSARGKPFLEENSSGIKFNWSHSSGHFLFAAAQDFELGVDLENKNADRAWQKISERFFSEEDVRKIKAQPNELYAKNEFFRTWVLKESLVKATGEGIDENFSKLQSPKPSVSRIFDLDSDFVAAVTCLHDHDLQWTLTRRDLE